MEQENPERAIDSVGVPGIDLRNNLTISLEEAVFSAEKQIEFIREVACSMRGEVVFDTLRDTAKFRAPQCVESGQLLRPEQQGIPR